MEKATSRSEKSLSTLTKKFLEMLKSEKILDLNEESEMKCEICDLN